MVALVPPPDRGQWLGDAACRTIIPELFFPRGRDFAFETEVAMAKAVCSQCPVVQQCLTWAIDSGQDEGVWGGMMPRERTRYRRQMRRELERRSA